MFAQRLKTETRSAHEALDHHPLLKRLFEPAVSVETYKLILQAMLGVQECCEIILCNVAKQFPPHSYLNQASRIPLLKLDLEDLYTQKIFTTGTHGEVNAESLGVAGLDNGKQIFSADLSANAMNASYVGMAYVIEGSALGGQYIARHLQTTKPDFPTRFFSSQGLDHLQRWTTFWDFARAVCPIDEHHTAVKVAIKTFDLYRLYMDVGLSKDSRSIPAIN